LSHASRGPGGGAAANLSVWLTTLGPLAVRRPPPSIGRALAGVGGAVLAVGVVALGGDRWASSGSSGVALVLTGGLLAASLTAMRRPPSPLAVAGVAASGVAAPALAFFLTAGGGLPSLRVVALSAGILVLGLYAVGPWKGHTFHLSVLVVAGWVVALSLGNLGVERPLFGGFASLAGILTGAGAASMVVGVAYLGIGSWLHDEGLEGMATPFLAVAALSLAVGALAVVRDSAGALQGLVALAVGAAVAFVGARCRRRGTTWIGVGLAAFGVVPLASGLSDGAAVTAILVAVSGAGLVALSPWAAAVAGDDDGTGPMGGLTGPTTEGRPIGTGDEE